MTKVNKPKIRFKNFNDSWSLRKLSDTQTDFKDGNYGEAYPKETDLTSSTQGVPFLRGSDLDNGKLTLTSARYITQSKHNELISGHLIEDDIVIAVRGSLGSLGYVGPDNEGWNINSQLAIIRTRKIELIGNYLIQFLLSNRGNKEISSHITGTALKQLPIKQLKNIKVPIPKIEEQTAIGALFRTLDDLLASYKDNLANYQSLKATMLSKMFSKAGHNVPEIRLDGFDGEWENKILSEVTNITMGQSPKSENYTDNPNDYILVQGNADIKDKQVVPRLWTTEVTKMAEIGDIILTVRAPVGDIGKTDYNVVIGRGVAAIKGNDFIFYTLEKMKMTGFWNRFSTGSTFDSISSNDIKEAIIQIPTLKEQQAIGAYFSNLDNLISAHQEKIFQLETLKKKLLQDMFI